MCKEELCWTDFFMEFSNKILEYKDNRNELIEKIIEAYDGLEDINLPTLYQDENGQTVYPPLDIDPFTIYALFNRNLTHVNRKKIMNALKDKFSISSQVPIKLNLIPLQNLQRFRFFWYGDRLGDEDIDNLWDLFEYAIEYADSKNEQNRANFISKYNEVIQQNGVEWNITFALYWIRPFTFMSLDSYTREYFINEKSLPNFIDDDLKRLLGNEEPINGERYINLCEEASELFENKEYIYNSFPELFWCANSKDSFPYKYHLNYTNFYRYLDKNNFYFDKKTVENFLLSLKVKPFTILTGNSGTGKTKLSQLFANYRQPFIDVVVKMDDELSASIKSENLNYYLPLDEYQGIFDGFIDDIQTEIKLEVSPKILFEEEFVSENIQSNEDEFKIKIKINDLQFFLPRNHFTGNMIFTDYNGSNPQIDDKKLGQERYAEFFHLQESDKYVEVLLDENSTNAKFYLSVSLSCLNFEEIEEYLGSKEDDFFKIKLDLDSFKPCPAKKILHDTNSNSDNYEIIPVGANWTDNRNIFGFYNVITKKYQTTPALDLILETNKSTEPHFLILDEMNLSHVERYFADFLSAIESKECVPLYSEKNIPQLDDESEDENIPQNENSSEEENIPPKLHIPENLFVIGTVNVDETTYMFSPKVLDRANVLEFETFSKKFSIPNFMGVEELNNLDEKNINFEKISYLEDPLRDSDILKQPMEKLKEELSKIDTKIPKEGGEGTKSLWFKLSEDLETIHKILKPSGFDFGFRVVKEILSFMYVAYIYESFDSDADDWEFDWERYFDAQIKQKILPKIHGSKKVLGGTLNQLLAFCISCEIQELEGELKALQDESNPKTFDETTYPTSAKKIAEMKEVLDNQRYVSFIN